MNPRQKLTKARVQLLVSQPFYGTLALRLAPREDATCETMSTDGRVIRYNPQWVDALPMDELTGVLAHEVMHVANGHCWRRGQRDPSRWNVACDYAINGAVLDAGFALPDSGLHDAQFDGLSAETIYNKLPGPPEGGDGGEEPAPGAQDPGGCGAVEEPKQADGNPVAPAEVEALAREWKAAMVQAANCAKGMGSMSEGIDRTLQEALHPKAPWREILRRFITQSAKDNYQWFPPNRRYVHMGIYLPSMRSETLPPVVVVIDTSGSISDKQLAQFIAELNSILEDANPSEVHLVYADARVCGTEVYTPEDLPIKTTPHGRGGTNFVPAFEWVDEHNIDPCCLIYLTDLECSDYPTAPDYPTLWVTPEATIGYGYGQPPFGDTIALS